MDEVIGVVRRAFGRDLDFDDIYRHVTCPEEVCLLREQDGSLVAMRSHNRRVLSGIPALVLEGAAVDPSRHGNGIYGKLLAAVDEGEAVIGLRTQNPRVYAALEGYCRAVYPGTESMPEAIREIQKALAQEFKCQIDEKGVVRGYYGSLFYKNEPLHERVSVLFKEKLKMDLQKGDALVVVGVK